MAVREVATRSAGRSGEPSLLIPERSKPHGPVTAARLRRSLVGYLVVVALGMVPVFLDASAGWKALGLGVVMPGGGFVYTSDPLFAALTFALFVLSLVAWFGTGNILAPPVVWLGAAVLAVLRTHTGIWVWAEAGVPLAVAAVLGIGFIVQSVAFRAASRRRLDRNRYLQSLEPIPAEVGATPPLGPELSTEDLASQRYLLDLALQPVDRFDGFTFIDQFQTAAVRYQINFSQYALALAQYTRTPAFHGYLSEAQRRLIAKMQDLRVWKYWRLENLWGNLDPDPDPIPKDNIMLSGYLGLMIGLYESNTGDDSYDAPGSIVFRWNGRKSFRYDHPSIVGAVYENFRSSPFGMFPCEPNWIYTGCNAFGINTLLVHDRLHGTGYAQEAIDGYRHAVNVEFLTPDGRVTAIRSSRLGVTIPSLTSTMADAGTAFFLAASLPEVAQRTWALVRRELIDHTDGGRPKLEMRGWDKIDVGSYRRSDAGPYAICSAAAREMGDEELFAALTQAMDEKYTPEVSGGARRYRDASLIVNGMGLLGRFGRAGGYRDLISRGLPPAWQQGPVLADAPYPDVLVARAVTDGVALDLVLQPGNGGGRKRIGIGRLVPGRSYSAHGTVDDPVVADDMGRAVIELDLAGRTEVRIAPRG
ncbi:MAG: hypothetical protein ACRDKG_17340 [Actinomycetota bacterium]